MMARVSPLCCLALAACFTDPGPGVTAGGPGSTGAPATSTGATSAPDPTLAATTGAGSTGAGSTSAAEITGVDASTTTGEPAATTGDTTGGGDSTTGAPASPCGDDPELRACFRFEQLAGGALIDESPYAHHLAADQLDLVDGASGQAVDLSLASKASAQHADHLSPGQDLTVAVWFYAEAWPGPGFNLMILVEKDDEYTIYLDDEGVGCAYMDGTDPGVYAPIEPGRWTHVACVRAAFPLGSSSLYVDGVFVGDENSGLLRAGNKAPLALGKNSETGNYPYTGRLDELRIFGRALDADEVAALAAP